MQRFYNKTGSVIGRKDTGFDVAAGMKRLKGDLDFFHQYVIKFSHANESTADEIRKALSDGRLALAESIAHALKGGALTIAAVRVSEAAAALELALSSGDTGPFDDQLEEIERSLDEVKNTAAVLQSQ